MRRISIDNPRVDNTFITDLSADYVAAALAATIRSNVSFQSNDLAIFGNPGEELTELKKISSLSGSTGFVLPSALNFAHNKGTPIYKVLWDFVSIEANYGAGWVVITASSIQWDSKNNKTIYFDANGTSTTSYRFRFYNSATTSYSEYSPTLTGAGYTKFQIGYHIKRARVVAGDKQEKYLTTDELLQSATRAKNIIRAHNPKYWFWKVDGYKANKSIVATSGNSVYTLANMEYFGTLAYIEYQYNANARNEKWVLEKKENIEFLKLTGNLNRADNDFPRCYRLLPPDASSPYGYFEVENEIQSNSVGTFYISFYKEEPDYDDVADTTAIIMPEILQDYLIAVIYEAKGNEAMAKKYYDSFTGPQAKKKTSGIEALTGIALLDQLDQQYNKAQSQPQSLVRFRGQRGYRNFYGNRSTSNPDLDRENYFDNSRE
jgi:hypothetical protein